MIEPNASESGFTLIELLLVVAIIGIIAAIAVPELLRARVSANEASAIGSLRAIHSGEASYSSTCGHSGFAQSLDDLAKPVPGSSEGFVSSDLSMNGVVKGGYYVKLSADTNAVPVATGSLTCNAASADTVSSYFAEAHPVRVGTTGQRSFGTDARGPLYYRTDGATIAAGMGGASVMQ